MKNLICKNCGKNFCVKAKSKTKFCSQECRFSDIAKPFIGVSGCWNWPLSLNIQTGYGQFQYFNGQKRKIETAHRMSYSIFIGEIPDGKYICHKCDNRSCFNPSHIFAGTQKENIDDMHQKGRQPKLKGLQSGVKHWTASHPNLTPKGEDVWNSKLTDDDIRNIRLSKDTCTALAKIYKVSVSAISYVRKLKTWKHVV